MYVYRETEDNVWTVGFYDPKGEWHSDTDHPSKTGAAERVNFLNGGVHVAYLDRLLGAIGRMR